MNEPNSLAPNSLPANTSASAPANQPPALPDFNAQHQAGAGFGEVHGTGAAGASEANGVGLVGMGGTLSAAGADQSNSKALKIVLGVVGGGLVLIVVLSLFITQVAMRSLEADVNDPNRLSGSDSVDTVGDPNQVEENPTPPPSNDPPPEIFVSGPTTSCTYYPGATGGSTVDAGSSTIRGGGLETDLPSNWDYQWFTDSFPNLYDSQGLGRNVEGGWYSVISVGRVYWDERVDGPYPGTEDAAVALFQCYATSAGVTFTFGEEPIVTNYRSEAMTVDGYPAWIVQATYHHAGDSGLLTTSASVVTAVVVETPNGPSTLVSDVAADRPEHVEALDNSVAGLRVTE